MDRNWGGIGPIPLHWRHNEPGGVSNHQPHDGLFNRSFRSRSKKTSKLRVTGLCVRGIHRWPVNSPHKWPITRKMSPFDDVIMSAIILVVPARPSWNIMSRLQNYILKQKHTQLFKGYVPTIFICDSCVISMFCVSWKVALFYKPHIL